MAEKETKGSQSPVENIEHGELEPGTQEEIQRIKDKEARGEPLTVEEAGKLGGAARTGSGD